MTRSRLAAISTATFLAAIAVAVACVALGLCLAQPLEDVRPELVPLVNLGALAILGAVAITTFRYVLRKMRGAGSPGAG